LPSAIDLTGYFIGLCFAVFALFWIVAAFSTKRTVQGSWSWGRVSLVVAAIVVVLVRAGRGHLDWLGIQLWPRTLPTALLGDAVAFGGLLLLLWARVILGRNWSGGVQLKQDHELITRGPYRFVRHPIYSGVLLMALGWSIWGGHVRDFAGWALWLVLLWIKASAEEQLMTQHFGTAYRDYKRRVKALIPYVI
jgi:protein-S-isoprenylcysteine O-methyltransferase Ste14